MKQKNYISLFFALRSIPIFGFFCSLKLLIALMTNFNVKISPLGYKHKFLVRGNTSDAELAYNIFTRKEYPYINEPIDLIIDAGANVGYAAIYFAHNYPNARIISIEPEHTNFAILEKNCRKYPNIKILKKGLWWRNAHLKVKDTNAEKWGFEFEETDGDGISCVTLTDIIKKYKNNGIVLTKIDIEGAEANVFSKDPSWINLTNYIFVEIHSGWKKIFDSLSDKEYRAWISSENVVIKMTNNGADNNHLESN